MRFRERGKVLLLVFVLFFAQVSVVLAQGCNGIPGSGDPSDPGYNEDGCPVPLDTWVYVLVAAAVIFGTYRLYKNNKALAV